MKFSLESSKKIFKKCNVKNSCNEELSRDFSDKNDDFNRKSEPFCFLNIFKPRGITSFDVIYKLRKRFKIKKIGHSGTLDPEAQGVMQVAVGKATRLLDYLGSDKKYIAKLRFGYFSSTADAEGDIVPFNVPDFDYERLLAAINSMTGFIEQLPPAFSAVKVGGKKLCDLARKKNRKITCAAFSAFKNSPESIINKEFSLQEFTSPFDASKNNAILDKNTAASAFSGDAERSNSDTAGISNFQNNEKPLNSNTPDVLFKNFNNELAGVEIPKRTVEIYEAKLLSFVTASHPDNSSKKIPYEAEIEVFCSKGTYIRSFAVDLAAKLGTCAYLTSLVRTMAGKFDIKNSVQIDEAELDKHGINPAAALDLPEYKLNEEEFLKVLNGVSFPSRCAMPENKPLMLIFKNNLVSIALLSDNRIACKKVFK